ncbi:MAG: SDR family NAD(P)-dependent oxidoreductase [Oscillospiraceae bacterium]|nr:SDR family NAD(P)-dependent oxidoreductase [Oscillospiraceae bacterium]
MKKILVTGAGGFIGSHLTEKLVELGFDVRAFVRYNSRGFLGWLDNSRFKNKIDFFSGDIRDQNMVLDAANGMDWVFHLAALIAIPYSYKSQDSYVDTNVKGTLNILQATKRLNTKRVFITSTSEVYGTAAYVPIDELHPKIGQSVYSATKIGADKLAESFYKSFSLPITIVRPFNTYGPRQSARAVIPTIITQLLSKKEEIKLGNLSPTRDLNFIEDTVNGFIEIAKNEKTIGEEINIASNKEISMEDLANEIINQINPKARIVCDKKRFRPKKSEVNRLVGSNAKIKSLTAWYERTSLKEGIKKTIDWLRMNLKYYKINEYNV